MRKTSLNHRIAAALLLGLWISTAAGQDWSGNGQGHAPMTPLSTSAADRYDGLTFPGPPMRPTPTSRPAGWAGGGQAVDASPWPRPDAAAVVPTGDVQPCQGIRIIARVGSEAILESELIGAVNEVIEANKDRLPPDQVDKQRELLLQQRLKSAIEMKLIYQDARRTIPAERWPEIEKQLAKEFDENQLERMIEKAGVKTAREFDRKLRSLGTSLEREKRAFIERTLAQQWARQQVKRDDEITYDQMVDYYRRHQDEFTTPARAEWEELMVRFSKYPTRAAAFEAIARMGNQVLGGASLAEVAQSGSDGPTAAQGGRRDWTTKGSLVCEALDAALFNLPVGRLSPIIQGENGYHIIRVRRREEAVVKPFLEAQVDIKQKIVHERSEKQIREYMAKLEARTPVWTVFDAAKPGVQQIATPRPPLHR